MAIRNVVTRGYGAGASIPFVVTRGYLPAVEDTGSTVFDYGQRERERRRIALEIDREDEILLAMIAAFLEAINRWR